MKKKKGLRLHHRVRRRGKVMCWNPWPAVGAKVAEEITRLTNRPGFMRRMIDLSNPTGRVEGVRSYSEPALQNLPVPPEDGRKIMDALHRRMWADGVPPMSDEVADEPSDAAKSVATGIVDGLLPKARPRVSFEFVVPGSKAAVEDAIVVAGKFCDSYAQAQKIEEEFWNWKIGPDEEAAVRARCLELGIDYDQHFKTEQNND